MNSDPSSPMPPDDEDTFLQDCLAELPGSRRSGTESQSAETVEREAGGPGEDDTPQVFSISTIPVLAEAVCSDSCSEAGPQIEPVSRAARLGDLPTPLDREVHKSRDASAVHLATSTFLSLVMVLVLLLLARLMVPSLVESIRYGWHRGELRAEYELSGQRLKNVSLDSLADVSQLVSQRLGASVVHINMLRDLSDLNQAERLLASRHPGLRYEGQGSGFVIDEQGLILTNHHVVEGAGTIEVTMSDGRRLIAEVVGLDPQTDLAVLKVPTDGLLAIEWGDSDEMVVGTPVWAVGSPFGLQQTVTFGIISGKHRVDFQATSGASEVRGGTPYGDLMQSDVALNPGNSGGPLVNSMGQVVGVNAAILGDTFRGVSFSIPSQVARRVAQHLIEEGSVPRGWLGVELANLDIEERYLPDGRPRRGVYVRRIPSNMSSPAREAGIQVGDLIVDFEGLDVLDTASLIRMIGEAPVGSTVKIGVERDDVRIDFEVRLDRRQASF